MLCVERLRTAFRNLSRVMWMSASSALYVLLECNPVSQRVRIATSHETRRTSECDSVEGVFGSGPGVTGSRANSPIAKEAELPALGVSRSQDVGRLGEPPLTFRTCSICRSPTMQTSPADTLGGWLCGPENSASARLRIQSQKTGRNGVLDTARWAKRPFQNTVSESEPTSRNPPGRVDAEADLAHDVVPSGSRATRRKLASHKRQACTSDPGKRRPLKPDVDLVRDYLPFSLASQKYTPRALDGTPCRSNALLWANRLH
jgi:hypothetical protein